MRFHQSQFSRNKIVIFSLLFLVIIAATPDRQWAKSAAVAQCPTITLTPLSLPDATTGGPLRHLVEPAFMHI